MAHATDMSAKCLNPKCQREAQTRGLCAACYVRATEVVRERLTTWKKLEAAKKILPSHWQKTSARKWLLGHAS
jgi:hypothetical protein